MVKIKRLLCAIMALFCMALPSEVFGAELYQMRILQAEAEKPKVVAYFSFYDTNNNAVYAESIAEENISVYLGNEKLKISEFETQKESGFGVSYYYLVDNSTSVSEKHFSEVKKAIKEHISEKAENDKIIVISFASEINVVLDGTEDKSSAINSVDGMKRASGGTRLYDAIAKATDLIDTNKISIDERAVIFVATDGVDKVAGGNTVSEVTARLKESDIPIYAFGYDFASKESLDSLGELARTTTGKMTVMSLSGISGCILGTVNEVQNTYRIAAFSETNITEGGFADVRIEVENEGESYEDSIAIPNDKWQKDGNAPKITGVSVKDEYHIEVAFSENVEISDISSAFAVFCGEKELAVKSADYSEERLVCEIETEEKLYNGEYLITAGGVKDISMEKNALENGEYVFISENVPKDFEWFINEYKLILIIAAAVILLVILIPIIIIAGRKKSAKKEAERIEAEKIEAQKEEEARKFGNAVILPQIEGVNAEITVIDSHRIERKVKCVIGGAYIIGRDGDKCDLAVEDRHLSHQHMALIYEDGLLSIQDLESTNGTKVNGIKITRIRTIGAGDIIEAGNTRFSVKIIP